MRRKSLICVLLALLILSAATGQALFSQQLYESLDKVLPTDPLLLKGTLHNGLTYYVRENENPEDRIMLRLVVKAGSILENENQRGLAHFLEHMAFNGTENFPGNSLVDFLEREGIRFGPDLNAYTGYDNTVYLLDIPAGREDLLDNSLMILHDWASAITNEPEEIEKERGVVIEEWRKSLGAAERIAEVQRKALFGESRYAERVPIGTIEVLENFEREDIVSFYRDWYRPDLMAVIAVGDFDSAVMEEKIKGIFSSLPLERIRKKRIEYTVPVPAADSVSVVSDSEAVSAEIKVVYYHDNPGQSTVSDYRESIRSSLFFSMLNNRFEERRQEPDPPFIRAGAGAGRLVLTRSVFSAGCTADPRKIDEALSALAMEFSRIQTHGFTVTEFERAKEKYARIMLQLYREAENTESIALAEEYTRNFMEGEYVPGIEYEYRLAMELIDEIDIEEVSSLASHYISGSGALLLVSMPETGDVPDGDELLRLYREKLSASYPPYIDSAAEGELVPEMPAAGIYSETGRDSKRGIVYYTLSNGARLAVKQTDFKNDQILFEAFSYGGHSTVDDDEWVSANLAPGIVSRGALGNFSRIQLDKYLDGKIVSLAPYIGEAAEGFSGSSSVADLETLFQLLYLYFTASEKDAASFESYVSRLETYFMNQDASPDVRFARELMTMLTSGHPRGKPFDSSIIREIELDTAYKVFREKFFDPGDFTYIFTGSAEPEVIASLAAKYLAFFPDPAEKGYGSESEETWKDTGIRLPEGKVSKTVYAGSEDKAQVALVFNGDFSWSRENLQILTALSEAADMRLRDVIREDEGGTYSVSVYPSVGKYPLPQYQITVYFACDPGRAGELKEAVFRELEGLKEQIPEGTLQKFRNSSILEFRKQLNENSFWLSAIKDSEFDGSGLEWIDIYGIMAENITEKDISDAASLYLDPDRYVLLTMYPESMDPEKKGQESGKTTE